MEDTAVSQPKDSGAYKDATDNDAMIEDEQVAQAMSDSNKAATKVMGSTKLRVLTQVLALLQKLKSMSLDPKVKPAKASLHLRASVSTKTPP